MLQRLWIQNASCWTLNCAFWSWAPGARAPVKAVNAMFKLSVYLRTERDKVFLGGEVVENKMRQDEMRIVIRTYNDLDNAPRLIPANVFKRTFTKVYAALKAAHSELPKIEQRSQFFISHLAMGSNEIGVTERCGTGSTILSPSIDLFGRCVASVYRSDYQSVVEYKHLAKKIVELGKAFDDNYPSIINFGSDSIPLDSLFSKQTKRLEALTSDKLAEPSYFSGSAIGSFDGRLESLDYRGATWKGSLVLPGGKAQIECVFDRNKGEDEFNRFGNKRVSINGRAIYTGDSQLPERIEVVSIEEVPVASEAIDIRGSLTGRHYFTGWDVENKNIQ